MTVRHKIEAKYGTTIIWETRDRLCVTCIHRIIGNLCGHELVPITLDGTDCPYYIYDITLEENNDC